MKKRGKASGPTPPELTAGVLGGAAARQSHDAQAQRNGPSEPPEAPAEPTARQPIAQTARRGRSEGGEASASPSPPRIGRDRLVKLPCSGRRKDVVTFCKLVRLLKSDPVCGIDYVGEFFRPGKLVGESQLRPDRSWPDVPVLIECAGTGANGPLRHGSRSNECTWIVWRYADANWQEVSRLQAQSLEWCRLLAPVVAGLLQPAAPSAAPDLQALSLRLAGMLDRVLSRLDVDGRRTLCALLYDQLAGRIAAAES